MSFSSKKVEKGQGWEEPIWNPKIVDKNKINMENKYDALKEAGEAQDVG